MSQGIVVLLSYGFMRIVPNVPVGSKGLPIAPSSVRTDRLLCRHSLDGIFDILSAKPNPLPFLALTFQACRWTRQQVE